MIELSVPGPRLDAAAAPGFKTMASAVFSDQPRRALIDLSQVTFVDSTGLGVLVSLMKLMPGDGALAIVGAQQAVRRLFQITRLDSVLPLYASREEAMAALSTGETAAR